MSGTQNDVRAHSDTTGRDYPNWQQLVEEETNGFVVVCVSDRPNTLPLVVGPFITKDAASRARARLRPGWVREERPFRVRTYVRHLWRDIRTAK